MFLCCLTSHSLMKHPQLNDAGIACLAAVIRDNTTLTRLELTSFNITNGTRFNSLLFCSYLTTPPPLLGVSPNL